ncbi:E3 ubiquitin-protein ligase TRIM39-like [Ambystoma mexicanum]|uniref:E3 ubiquitin-protein ligase TRIM39-like n=1 Tax=Ambystoma mexicanum TaxID=8296 RepID=UPI0037E82738
MSRRDSEKAPFTFHDVAACFSEEEWQLLQEWQKELYKNIMKEIHQALFSLGAPIASSIFSLRAKEMEYLQGMNPQDIINQSTGAMILHSEPLLLMNEEENQCVKNAQDTERRESKNSSRPESPHSDNVLMEKQDVELNLFDHPYLRGERSADTHAALVTFDPDTAHPVLVLSEHGRHVRWGDNWQNLPDSPKRFSASPCVLGREGFSSGRHYWELKLMQEGWGGWCVGVALETVKRDGLVSRSPEGGVWAVQRGYNGQYEALTCPSSPLSPCESPKKLGVYLDYEGGELSLHNADTMEHLYTFTGTFFPQRVFPLFSIWGEAELFLV